MLIAERDTSRLREIRGFLILEDLDIEGNLVRRKHISSVKVLVEEIADSMNLTNSELELALDTLRVGVDMRDMGNVSDGHHTFNELYEHRYWLFEALAYCYREMTWISRKHSDGTPSYDGWFVAGINFPTKQISYHLPNRMWGIMCSYAAVCTESLWDGHTSDQVIERLQERALGRESKV